MKIFDRFLHVAKVTSSLFTLSLLWGVLPAGAQPFTNAVFFTGNITLDGDISDFFMADGLTVRPGVCLANDANGLDESPLDSQATRDAIKHPSGFNQRRIMTAYNPNLNGGTIFIGVDLPGGSGADSSSLTIHSTPGNANPNFVDGVVGADFGGGRPGIPGGRGKIVPFDADANGEADTIGRKVGGAVLLRCPSGSDTNDIITCAAGSQGFTDNPRMASGDPPGARENYVATVIFGDGTGLTVEVFESSSTPAGIAQVNISPGLFGASVSLNAGVVLGFDVEIAITNVIAAVPDECARLKQTILVDSGSNRDGASQGEDQNMLTCTYNLPRGLTLTKQCPPGTVAPGGLLTFTGSVRNTGQVAIVNLAIFDDRPVPNTPVPLPKTTLVPGEILFFTNSYTVPVNFTNCSITDTLTATGLACGVAVGGTASATCPLFNTFTMVCPPDTNVQCFANIPPPNTNLIVSGGIAPVTVTFLTNIYVTNGCIITNTRIYRAFDACQSTNTCTQIIVVRDTTPPMIFCPSNATVQCNTPLDPSVTGRATAIDNCDTNPVITFSNILTGGTCPATGLLRRVWTATDCTGNSSVCTQLVTIVDTIPPVINCPSNVTVQCNTPTDPSVTGRATATDNCDTNIIISFLDTRSPGACAAAGFINRIWVASDCSGNSSTCTQRVSIVDTIPPIITSCPPNITVPCVTNVPPCGTNFALFISRGGAATDNCATNLLYSCSDGPLVGGPCGGTIARVHTVRDNCGNFTNCTQLITVTSPPPVVVSGLTNILTCATSNATFCIEAVGACGVTYAWFKDGTLIPGATNNCYTVINVRPVDTGEYCVIATAACGSVTNCARLTVYGALGDFVWYDRNTNGIQDVTEPGVSNVLVQLMNCAGQILRTTNTDASGFYLFTKLVPGDYKVTFTNRPPGFLFTIANAGADDTKDSDADQVTGMSQCVTIGSGETNRTVDAGLVTLPPNICVIKEIACFLPGDTCSTFGKIATGYSSANQSPAFCYRITINNCGPYNLTNVIVLDNKLGNLTTNYFPTRTTVFPTGQTLVAYFKMAWAVDTTNIVTVIGQSMVEGHFATNSDAAIAVIKPASIRCDSFVTSPDDIDNNPNDSHVRLPADSAGHLVTFTTVICNDGQAPLTAVTVGNPILASLGCAAPAPFDLPVGACYTNSCTLTLNCTPISVLATNFVSAIVDTRNNACGWDLNGSNITVTSRCGGSVDCLPCKLAVTKTACILRPGSPCGSGLCVDQADFDSKYGHGDDTHGLWLPGIGTDFDFIPGPGLFVENPDGTAKITGTVRRRGNNSKGFLVEINLTGLTTTPPPGSPKKQLDKDAYIENGGPIDPRTWRYYTGFSGTLTGIDTYAGAILNITGVGEAFQVGVGASGKNLKLGASAWFTWVVVHQPNSGSIQSTGQGDINIDIFECPPSGPSDSFCGDCVNVQYTYTISNTGDPGTLAAVNISVTDDQLGPVPGSPIASLQPGQSITLTATATVCDTVTNTVTVSSADCPPVTSFAVVTKSCTNEICVREAIFDVDFGHGSDTHALWLPGIGTDFDFIPDPGRFVEKDDGTATITGTVRRRGNNSKGFIVNINLSGRTTTPPPGSPKKQLDNDAYVNNGGPIDPSTWRYYTGFSGTLTGIETYAGAILNITGVGEAFQVGVGASGKNLQFGASAWFTWIVVRQPNSGSLQSTGQGDINVDFFDCPPLAAGDAALGGSVWIDSNQNGRRDSGENGVANATVQLMDCVGNVLKSGQADGNGSYLFTSLGAGSYRVRFFAPSGYALTLANVGADTGDSDADPATGLSDCVTLLAQETNQTVDAGIYVTQVVNRLGAIGDLVWNDLNGNGVQGAGESGVSGVTVQLTDCFGNVVRTTNTSVGGFYQFTGVAEGSYRLNFVPPVGFTFSTPSGGTTACFTFAAAETNRTFDAGLVRLPALGLSASCQAVGGAIRYSGIVSNRGSVPLTNVQVISSVPSPGQFIVSIPAGGQAPFSFDYTSPACGTNITSIITATGSDSQGNRASNSVSTTCSVPCTTCISVVQEVACLLPGNSCSTFGKIVHSIRNETQIPGFCYSITIRNCGPTPLSNISVVDNRLGVLTGQFPQSLAAGESATIYFAIAWGTDTTNSAIASGQGPGGQTVIASDSAVALVSRGIVCDVIITSSCDLDGNTNDNHVTLPQGGAPCRVNFKVNVCNPGPVNLTNVIVNCPALATLGGFGGPAVMPVLLAGGCFTKEFTATNYICNGPFVNDVTVTATVINNGQACGYDSTGANVISALTAFCHSSVDCGPAPSPAGVILLQRADPPAVLAGGEVNYTYTVKNISSTTLVNVQVVDDNGTPDLPSDDFVAGTVPSLASGAAVDITRAVYPPISLCGPNSAGEMADAGLLIKQVLPDGNVKVVFVQGFGRNDNTYGLSALGWRRHRFGDLISSDHATFSFSDKSGQVVLKFMQDYCSESPAFPSGFGSLGVRGGDGGMLVGSANWVLQTSSSLAENLNKQPFLSDIARCIVNSPALNDPLSGDWEYRMIYTCIVDKAAFGSVGFGDVMVADQYNSPAKDGPSSFMPHPVSSWVTNVARVYGTSGSVLATNQTGTVIWTTNRP